MSAMPGRRFFRDADRAKLGGVCAGIAGYFDVNLKAVRILTIIAFFMAMPFTVIAYLAAVVLIPSESGRYGDLTVAEKPRKKRRHRCAAAAFSERDAASNKEDVRKNARKNVKRRCTELDERLVRLEKLVTSKRFQLEQEFRRL